MGSIKILVVGDSYYSAESFRAGLEVLATRHDIEYINIQPDATFEPRNDSERRLVEYEGNPDQVVDALTDHQVLIVHGAPVTRDVLGASPQLRMVCCARGGPVNVDLETAADLGITVTTTPGKNATAVAELTISLAVMLTRSVREALTFLEMGGRLVSTFDGARFFGFELSSMTIGLIGLGRVGKEVCARAISFGMNVLAFDPFLSDREINETGATPVALFDLVSGSDIVSLHARQTHDNQEMVDGDLLDKFKPGAHLINTAREGLVDEVDVMNALRSGQLGGVAVDVFHDGGPIARAVANGEERLIALPHIGGATHETMQRAAALIVQHIDELVDDQSTV